MPDSLHILLNSSEMLANNCCFTCDLFVVGQIRLVYILCAISFTMGKLLIDYSELFAAKATTCVVHIFNF